MLHFLVRLCVFACLGCVSHILTFGLALRNECTFDCISMKEPSLHCTVGLSSLASLTTSLVLVWTHSTL